MIASFVNVWTTVMSFLVDSFTQVIGVFWSAEAGGPTFVGVMALVMAGVAFLLLIFNIIRSFFAMHG